MLTIERVKKSNPLLGEAAVRASWRRCGAHLRACEFFVVKHVLVGAAAGL
jgi:hypothetical protein